MTPLPFISLPPHLKRLFVVGDIHGCVDELRALTTHLIKKESLSVSDLIIFVGDYIDRGPQSKQVVDYLLMLQGEHVPLLFLRGNHEVIFMDFLDRKPIALDSFLRVGGGETLQSYGLLQEAARDDLKKLLPLAHVSFFQNLCRYAVSDTHVIVHAGLHPLRPLDDQRDEDIYWIRDEFIQNIHRFKQTIIFGHTPQKEILLHEPYKIGIDTGLVYGHKLSCIEIVNRIRFQVRRGSTKVSKGEY